MVYTVDYLQMHLQLPVAFGNKPEVITYDESNLRRHLVECLKSKKFSPFPEYKNNKRVKRARAVTINQDVYCICCGTYFKKDANDSTDKFMASRCVCMNGMTRNV